MGGQAELLGQPEPGPIRGPLSDPKRMEVWVYPTGSIRQDFEVRGAEHRSLDNNSGAAFQAVSADVCQASGL